MRAIRLVATAVFRESVRDRVPLTVVGFGVLLLSASYLIGQLTAGQDVKIIKDLGLSALSLLGLLIATFIGIGLVAKEVEKRSIYSLLSRQLTREQFVVGKYLGLVLTLAVNVAAMAAALYVALWYQHAIATPGQRASWPAPAVDVQLMVAIALTFAELMLVTAIALFFSTFAGPMTAVLFTLALWIAGHFNADLRRFEEVVDSPALAVVARGFYYLLPNLAPFNVRAEVVHGVPIAASHVALTIAYALVYIAVLLLAAMAVFRRRDFK
jgi:ABC-type transport system involved in multi-copper enzyme maturation permease subunit